MNREERQNPYLLLTPGPLSTTRTVKEAMLNDWCTWDDEYNSIVQEVRSALVELATEKEGYTSVLMQGSGTFCVEGTICTAVPADGKLLALVNGIYGERIVEIARRLGISTAVQDNVELRPPDLEELKRNLEEDPAVTHVIAVHCETTTGILNPVEEVAKIVKEAGKVCIVDAMSSFGGIEMDVGEMEVDFLVSSANKCIQGVPGFGFVIALREELEKCEGRSRSLSLDLFDQWREMEEKGGKWRFTSPTHTVRAFVQALWELEEEGGVAKRAERYRENHRVLMAGMEGLGFEGLLQAEWQSPIITSFLNPDSPEYDFRRFYDELKKRGFVIYPGKVTTADTFRIGNIGDVAPDDMRRLVAAVEETMFWK